MLPVSALRDSTMLVAVRSSRSCTGSVPFSPSDDSHSTARPPVGAAFTLVTVAAEGCVDSVLPQSWQNSRYAELV